MVVQLPEWKRWRISGEGLAWEVQELHPRKDGDTWDATNYFPSLEGAIGYAYERTLRESAETAGGMDAMAEESIRILLENIASPHAPRYETVPVTVQLRESARPLGE